MEEELIATWLKRLAESDIDSCTTQIDGIPVSVDEDDSSYSVEITQTLRVEDRGMSLVFSREGAKEISYDRWVDTNWFGWEVSGPVESLESTDSKPKSASGMQP
jgi:hypothetical protein